MNPAICEAEMREQYDRSRLSSIGISFERALQSPAICISLIATIKNRRKQAARYASAAAIQYQQIKEAA